MPRNSIVGKKTEKIFCAYVLAARFAALSSSNSRWNARSRLKAWTIAIPDSDSATWAVTAEIRLRTSSCAAAERTWNQRVRRSEGGRTTSETSPSRQSFTKSAITAAGGGTGVVTRGGRARERTAESAATARGGP